MTKGPGLRKQGVHWGYEKKVTYFTGILSSEIIFRMKWTREKRQLAVSSQQLWAGTNANVCKYSYTRVLGFLPPGLLLFRDTVALSSHLVSSAIWD